MKIRNYFVSNSSSTSFIIAGDKNAKVEVNLSRKVSEISDKQITDKDDLLRYFNYEYGSNCLEDKGIGELFNKCVIAIKEGKTIFIGTVSNQDEEILNQCIHNGKYTIVGGSELIY